MALTKAKVREILSKAGVTSDNMSEAVDAIIDGNVTSIEALREDVAKYKAEAERLSEVEKELNTLKADKGESYKEKYEKEHKAFEDFKNEQTAKETKAAKAKAYRELLQSAGVNDKRFDSIIKLTDLDGIELDADGKIKDADKHTQSIKTEWADFIVSTNTKGTKPVTPPTNKPSSTKWTKEEIMKIKDTTERQKAWCEYVEQERTN